MAIINLKINGNSKQVDVDPATRVLWVLRVHLNMPGTKYGCGVSMCGTCNPDAAINMVQGAVVDGIGNALYGALTHKDGVAEQNNFNRYRMIRYNEAPKKNDVHFIENDIDPTGLGEPPFPPVFGAVANALYKNTGIRFYDQPYQNSLNNPA